MVKGPTEQADCALAVSQTFRFLKQRSCFVENRAIGNYGPW